MRYFVPNCRLLLIVTLCAGIALAAGCARRPTESATQPAGGGHSTGQSSDRNQAKPLLEEAKTPAPPKLAVTQEGVTLSWNDKAGRTMVAKARSDSFSLRTQVGTLLDFSAKLYENGALLASVSAPRAYVDTAKRTVMATGGVDLKFAKPQTRVRSEWIKWTPDTHRIVGNGGVTMTYPNGAATAAAFVGDTAKQTLELRDSGEGLEKQ